MCQLETCKDDRISSLNYFIIQSGLELINVGESLSRKSDSNVLSQFCKEVRSVCRQRVYASRGKASHFIQRIDRPEAQLEAMLMYGMEQFIGKEMTIHVDPGCSKSSDLTHQHVGSMFSTGSPHIGRDQDARS